ncbi:MAG: DNA gyrase inhibitor YacG [Gammaproteobacteria bacterium]|nr:DNA gyrase inhibitor YacG [Gammaproteobacteria bacterium]
MQTKNIACPRCGKKETWTPENAFKPFCSERCKLIDLGNWASEQHKIAGEPTNITSEEEDKE